MEIIAIEYRSTIWGGTTWKKYIIVRVHVRSLNKTDNYLPVHFLSLYFPIGAQQIQFFIPCAQIIHLRIVVLLKVYNVNVEHTILISWLLLFGYLLMN